MAIENGGVTSGECGHSEIQGWFQKLGRGGRSQSGWSASQEGGCQLLKEPQKWQRRWKSGEQNGDCGGTDVDGGNGSLAGHEMATIVVVQWSNGGRSLTSGGPKWK